MRFYMRGKMNSIILNVLKNGNKYGLEIIKEIKTLTNGQLDVKLPSLYSNLHKLESDGYISSYWENSEIGGKRRYSALTEKGFKYVQDHPHDFEEYKSVEQKLSNTSSSLAIQPDFFNKIEHQKRQEDLKEENLTATENEIPNYSILDFVEYKNQDENVVKNDDNIEKEKEIIDYRVFDKTDAVLLTDKQIIPQNSSTSLLYKPTTLSNKDLVDDINYQDIFGDLMEKNDENLDDKVNLSDYDFTEKNNGILLDPNIKSKYSDDYLSMVSNVYDKKENAVPIKETILNKHFDLKQTVNQSIEPKIEVPSQNTNSCLLKEKLVVDDNLKANIFLKKSNLKPRNNYAPPTQFQQSIIEKNKVEKSTNILNLRKNEEEQQVPTNNFANLTNFISDCEANGIYVQKYRNNEKKPRSHRVFIHKTNLLSSILSFATLLILMFITYFAFKSSLSDLKPITYLFIGLTIAGLLYPVTVAIVTTIKGYKIVGYYNIKKEWLPRIIIFSVIVLLTFAINFFAGMNLSNIENYLAYICLPIVASLMIFADFIFKTILINYKAFRED